MDGESPTQQTDLAEQYVNICAVCATAFGRPTKREVICPACNPAQQAQPDKSVGILPCPCCGYRAELEQVPHDPQELNAGAYYIECKRAGCGLTTRLAFSCKADAVPGLVAAWNRRPLAAPQPAQADEARILREFDGAIAAARLLGATDAKRGFGCYTEEDARLERAWHESIASHRRRAAAYLARTGGKEE